MRAQDEAREAFFVRVREATRHNPDLSIQDLLALESVLEISKRR